MSDESSGGERLVAGLQAFADALRANGRPTIYGGQLHCPRCGDSKPHDVEDTGDRARWLCRECGHASYTVQREK